ncbi:MAG: hypothetical protein KDH98_13000 [Calditrichaeota bacterium]|nr:hypothetical protein [Calditrichota bacterium]
MLIITSYILLFATNLFAKVWIVDNNPFPVGDYTTLSAVHGVASPGDTVYVYPSGSLYEAIILTKKLFLFGAGIDLDLHGGQSTQANSTLSGTMGFNAGSEGSVMEGFDGNFIVGINVDDIVIKRCEIKYLVINGNGCMVLQNEIVGSAGSGDSSVLIGSNYGNIIIANNKIYNTSSSGLEEKVIASNISSTLVIVNNVLNIQYSGDTVFKNLSPTTLVQNNIIIKGNIPENAAWAIYQYNMSNGSQIPDGGVGNIENIDMSIVFEDPANFDTGLHLLPGSPAAGTGFGGADMGIYGGDYPFIDGGYPGIPAVYFIESQVITVPQNGLNVRFKAKSNAR